MISLLLFLTQPAHGTRLHRCEATLMLPIGEIAIPGWGTTEPVARERARTVAWTYAAYHAQPDLLVGQLVMPEALAARQARLLGALDAAEGWAVPGYAVQPGACADEPLAGERGEAWTASWPGDDQAAVRNDPAVAVEAIRRRTCFKGYQNRLGEALLRAAEAEEPERSYGLSVALRGARDALLYCGTQSPDIRAAGAGLPAPEREGTFECARPRRTPVGWRTPHAYSDDLDGAREAALQLDLWTLALQSRADGWAAARAAPDRRLGAVFGAWGGIRSLVVANDVAEQALLLCRVGRAKPVGAAWVPASGVAEQCPQLSKEPFSTPASPPDLAAVTERRCGAISRADLSKASGASGLARSWTCAASCSADVRLLGWEPAAVGRSGEIGHATAEDATRALSAAVRGRDFMAFGILTGGVIWQPEFAAAFKRDPSAFWASIVQAQESGQWAERAEWVQLDDHWVLSFK
jgi:hypothetical protein